MSQLLDQSQSIWRVNSPNDAEVYKTTIDGHTVEISAPMWYEGVLFEDPALFGIAGLRHNIHILAPSGANGTFENVTLQADRLTFDFFPRSFAPQDFESIIRQAYIDLIPKGLWQDYPNAVRWAESPDLKFYSRDFPNVKGVLTDTSNLNSIQIQNRFFQRSFLPDEKGNPIGAVMRFYAFVYDDSHFYGSLAILSNEVSREHICLDYPLTIPRELAKLLFERACADYDAFLKSLS